MFELVSSGNDIRVVVVADEMDRFRPVFDFQPQLGLHAAAAVTGAGGIEIGFGLTGNLLRHKFDRFAHRQDGSGKKCGQKEKYLVVHEVNLSENQLSSSATTSGLTGGAGRSSGWTRRASAVTMM